MRSEGRSAPDQRALPTWGRWGCHRSCPSPRVPGQGPSGATGVRLPGKSVFPRISEDQRRTSEPIPASVYPQLLAAQHPAAAPASPGPQRHLAGSAGGAFSLKPRLPRRGSSVLLTEQPGRGPFLPPAPAAWSRRDSPCVSAGATDYSCVSAPSGSSALSANELLSFLSLRVEPSFTLSPWRQSRASLVALQSPCRSWPFLLSGFNRRPYPR